MSNQPQDPQQPTPPIYATPGLGGTPGPGEPFDGATDPSDLKRPLYGASFGQAVKRFFKNYANFKGRASRSEYWWATLFIFLIELVPLALYIIGLVMIGVNFVVMDGADVAAVESGFGTGMALMIVGLTLLIIIGLALLVPSLSVSWRRLHDSNLAGPFWFLSLTSVGAIIVFVMTLLPSKPMGRRFDVSAR